MLKRFDSWLWRKLGFEESSLADRLGVLVITACGVLLMVLLLELVLVFTNAQSSLS